jgi:hypothetical protein
MRPTRKEETIMLISEANAIVGGLGKPSKMPGKAYGLPAKECKVGAALRKVKGSVCETCYAFKGRYAFQTVQAAEYRRLESLTDPRWVDAMVKLIKGRVTHFRWHDSGDIQNATHLGMIIAVALACPDTKFWAPSKEAGLVRRWIAGGGTIPSNLVVRMSGAMVDGKPPKDFKHTSTVNRHSTPTGHECPAQYQSNECGPCRACWDKTVKNVTYPWH